MKPTDAQLEAVARAMIVNDDYCECSKPGLCRVCGRYAQAAWNVIAPMVLEAAAKECDRHVARGLSRIVRALIPEAP